MSTRADMENDFCRSSTTLFSSDTSNSNPAARATVTYTPNENYNGQDSFQFRVNDDGEANSNIATVTIDIAAVNDAPIAEDDAATTDQGTPVIVDVLANDMDVDIVQESNGRGGDDDDSIILDSIPEQSIQGGSVARIISNSDDNDDTERGIVYEKIEYTPVEGFFGTDEFSYTIEDTNGATASATITVTVKQIVAEPEQEEELPNNTIEAEAEQEEEGIESEDDESNDD
jgi:Bacterial Ig domain